MALRLAWSTCPSVRFRRDGSWESQARSGRRASGCGARRAGARRAPAAAPRATPTTRARRRRPGSASRSRRRRSPCSPTRSAIGPDRTQQIPQNQHAGQPPIRTKAPLDVVFVIANQTDFDSQLELRGPRDDSSAPIPANSPATLQTDLPTGIYAITAADIPGASPAKLVVGPYRASSQNDVLLP